MKKIVFSDIYGTEIQVGLSRSNYIRLDLQGSGWPELKHSSTGEDVPYCLSMTINQAQILVCALSDILEEQGE